MKKEVKIGLFAIVILCCTWAGIRFLSGIDIFSRSTDYYASYEKVDGVGTASSVIINGVKVGSVTEVIFDPSQSELVTLKLSVKRQYKLPKDTKAKIYSPGLMSSMAVGLDLGTSSEYLAQGDTISSYLELGLMDSASAQLSQAVENITEIAEKLSTTLDGVNDIIATSSDNVNNTVANLSSISNRLNRLLASQSGNINDAIENFAAFAQELEGNSESITTTLNNLNALSQEFSEANIGDNLGAALAELNTTLTKVNKAEGTAGQLLNDEELYNNLAAVSSSLDALIQDMQANPKRYVHFSLF